HQAPVAVAVPAVHHEVAAEDQRELAVLEGLGAVGHPVLDLPARELLGVLAVDEDLATPDDDDLPLGDLHVALPAHARTDAVLRADLPADRATTLGVEDLHPAGGVERDEAAVGLLAGQEL